MKNTKRILAAALCVLMLVSCMGLTAFAATPDNVRQYGAEGGYLAIGDSVCRGCGSEGYFIPSQDHSHYYDYTQRNVEGAFPYVVAQAVGCSMPADRLQLPKGAAVQHRRRKIQRGGREKHRRDARAGARRAHRSLAVLSG